jgi:hypothetical protein
MKKLYILLLLFFVVAKSFAQTSSCAQTIRLAQSIYDQGRLHELENLINKQIEKGDCSKAEKVSLYKLLTLAYIYLEEPELSDDTMLKLLKTDNYFEINPAVDPAEFVALYNTFRTKEIYRVGATLGANASRPNVASTYTAVELTDDSKYKYGIAILFGATADLPLTNKLTLHGDLLYFQKKFELNLKVDRSTVISMQSYTLTNQFQGFETQNWLSLPLSLEYSLAKNRFNPYVAGGASFDYRINAQLRGERIKTNVSSVQETNFDLNPQREKINLSALVATGIKMKVSGGYFIAEVRYLHGLTNVNSPLTAFANQQAAWEQGYADPVFKISSLSVSGAYVVNIFNPKKKKIRSSK